MEALGHITLLRIYKGFIEKDTVLFISLLVKTVCRFGNLEENA